MSQCRDQPHHLASAARRCRDGVIIVGVTPEAVGSTEESLGVELARLGQVNTHVRVVSSCGTCLCLLIKSFTPPLDTELRDDGSVARD